MVLALKEPCSCRGRPRIILQDSFGLNKSQIGVLGKPAHYTPQAEKTAEVLNRHRHVMLCCVGCIMGLVGNCVVIGPRRSLVFI